METSGEYGAGRNEEDEEAGDGDMREAVETDNERVEREAMGEENKAEAEDEEMV